MGTSKRNCLLAAILVQGLASSSGIGREEGASRLFSELARQSNAPNPDFAAAFKWARMVAESGSPDGQALLGYILSFGPDQLRHEDEARGWYQRSAEGGWVAPGSEDTRLG
jgi:TPR repeat protein